MIKSIIIVILTLSFIAAVVFLDVPGVQGILDRRKQIEVQRQQLFEKQELLAKVEKLTKLYNDNKENVERSNYVLPSNEDIPNLIVQLESLAFEQGLILEKIDLSVQQEGTKREIEYQQEKAIKDYKILIVNIKLIGSYAAFKSFLKATEENIRLIDVNSISFSSAEEDKEKSQIFEFDLSLNIYYQ